MKTVAINKAQATIKSKPVESVEIIIATEVAEENPLQYLQLTAMFERDAKTLCDALENVLPGGTFDMLLVEMLKRKVTHFVVPINS